MIETDRLVLRRWRDCDRAPFAAMSADPEVMDWLGAGLRTREQSDAQIDRFEAEIDVLGYGLLALARRDDGAFLGFVGLTVIRHETPAPAGVEIGWRLSRQAWGFGYATEAARILLSERLRRFALSEILSLTAQANLRSRAVMHRIGLHRRSDLDFQHPALAPGHPLRAHVVYSTLAA